MKLVEKILEIKRQKLKADTTELETGLTQVAQARYKFLTKLEIFDYIFSRKW